jgi:hypothetical protein
MESGGKLLVLEYVHFTLTRRCYLLWEHFPTAFFLLYFGRSRESLFLSLVARIALLSQSCSTEDQIEVTIFWFLTARRGSQKNPLVSDVESTISRVCIHQIVSI